MKKLKILFITRNNSKYIVPASFYLTEELGKLVELKLCHDSGHIEEVISKTGFTPDFIFINDYKENQSPHIEGLPNLKIPYAVGLHDIHFNKNEFLIKDEVKNVFTHYRDKCKLWYPQVSQNTYWLPHHANTDIYKDYHLHKDKDLLMMGATEAEYYPLRVLIKNKLSSRREFIQHQHPGYKNFTKEETGIFIGDKYAMEINRAKIFLTCGTKYNYPLRKYFEVTACNTLLLAPVSEEIIDLGFIPGVHFVSINENNFEEKADYYLNHDEERQVIANNGMNLTHTKHSTKQRASQFVNMVQEILNKEKNDA